MARHHPRLHNVCPSPETCRHTTDFPGEVCECCGAQVPTLLGTASVAANKLGTDIAGVFEMVAAGQLKAEWDPHNDKWMIWGKH